MGGLVARPANMLDSRDISKIHAFCWRETYHFMPSEVLEVRCENYRLRQWDAWFRNPNPEEQLFKILAGDKIVGFCFCKENEDVDLPLARGELHAGYVLPEYRGGIVGPLAISVMAKFLRSQNLSPISLWAFKENRIRLWYAQLGFRKVVTRDRVIAGHAIPEFGYVHPDVNQLIDHVDKFIQRHQDGGKKPVSADPGFSDLGRSKAHDLSRTL